MGLVARVATAVINLLYRIFDVLPRRNEVVFVSRRADEPSYDFEVLGQQLQQRGYSVSYLVKTLTRRNAVAYVGHAVREIYHLARCKACVLDRYDPVVSLIRFAGTRGAEIGAAGVERCFPRQPVVFQLWHAFGAFKKFGYQSLDTPEGRTSQEAKRFKIHRNYSWVFCSGQGSRQAYAQAFNTDPSRVVPFTRPQFHKLAQMAGQHDEAQRSDGGRLRVLMAPTLRKDPSSPHPFNELHAQPQLFDGLDADIVWSFHPLDSSNNAPSNVNSSLDDCDVVVTDYSSIVYEAFALGKRVLFYCPDIDVYRVSPGLNSDPALLCAKLVHETPQSLVEALQAMADGQDGDNREQLRAFVEHTIDLGDAHAAADDMDALVRAIEGERPW